MNVCVLGSGTWGTALARRCLLNGHRVILWASSQEKAARLAETHVHPNLPGMQLPETLRITGSLEEATKEADLVIFAVASVYVRQTAERVAPLLPKSCLLVDAAKGIEPHTLLTMTGVIKETFERIRPEIPWSFAAISGPTHAEEVALDLPSAIVSASEDDEAARAVQNLLMHPVFRVYTNRDLLGVELCGALKNVIALAAGISDGLQFGDNAKAALLTRGMAEMTRLGMTMGCQMETFMGLAGYGDMIVTATSSHSRNHKAGMLLGQGYSRDEAVRRVGQVVEGMNTLPAALELSEKYQVELPIAEAVDRILRGAPVRDTVLELMMREKKAEHFPSIRS